MNNDMREEYDDLLRKILEMVPGKIWESLTQNELSLLLQGLGEVDARTILLPAFKETITQYRPIPVESYHPRVK